MIILLPLEPGPNEIPVCIVAQSADSILRVEPVQAMPFFGDCHGFAEIIGGPECPIIQDLSMSVAALVALDSVGKSNSWLNREANLFLKFPLMTPLPQNSLCLLPEPGRTNTPAKVARPP